MQKDLSIVIPCYNENSRGNFQYRLDKLISFMCENTNIDFEIILVNDGSTDDTLKVIKYYEDNYEFVKVITYKKNIGKSHALKQGIKRAVGDYTLMMDADLNVPLKNINKFYNYISKATLHHLVIAVRTNKYENRSSARKFLSRMAHLSTSILLGIPNIKDTQCGFKMFKTDKLLLRIELSEFRLTYPHCMDNTHHILHILLYITADKTISEHCSQSCHFLLIRFFRRHNRYKLFRDLLKMAFKYQCI